MVSSPNLDLARTFIWLNARLIDRHRYTFLFENGQADPVLAALRPYQNPDGGFGHALEPDGRGTASQPVHVHSALQMLDEIDGCHDPIALHAVDYLASVAAPNGGLPFMLPSVRDHPRAPWWNVEGDIPPGSLLPTAGIAGLLLKNRVEHPWLARAAEFCWQAIATLENTHPYEVAMCLIFLDHAPDHERAEREAERLGHLVRERRLVALDPNLPAEQQTPPGYAPGEVHTPLAFAQHPSSLARRWFSDREIERDLDALVASQGADGGWFFNWLAWNPASTLEWRGSITLRALTILRAYGRLAP